MVSAQLSGVSCNGPRTPNSPINCVDFAAQANFFAYSSGIRREFLFAFDVGAWPTFNNGHTSGETSDVSAGGANQRFPCG